MKNIVFIFLVLCLSSCTHYTMIILGDGKEMEQIKTTDTTTETDAEVPVSALP